MTRRDRKVSNTMRRRACVAALCVSVLGRAAQAYAPPAVATPAPVAPLAPGETPPPTMKATIPDCRENYAFCGGMNYAGVTSCCGAAVCTEIDVSTSQCVPTSDLPHKISFAYYFANMQDPLVRAWITQEDLTAAIKKWLQTDIVDIAFFVNYPGAFLDTVAVTKTRYDTWMQGNASVTYPWVTGFLFNATMKGTETYIKFTITNQEEQQSLMKSIQANKQGTVYGMYTTTYIAHGEILTYDDTTTAYFERSGASSVFGFSWLLVASLAAMWLPWQLMR